MPFRALTLTGEQIRAGRALARWEQTELARRSGLSLETIKRLERIRGPVEANSRTLTAIAGAFAASGVEFEIDGGVGVRLVGEGRPAESRAAAPPPAEGRPTGGAVGMLHRLIYHSTMEPEVTARVKQTLDALLAESRRRNAELAITGALLASNGRFLQILEGDKAAVLQVYGSISTDPRHASIRLIESRPVTRRQFPEWSLCCGMFESDEAVLRREPALADGFHPELLTPAGALGLLGLMRDLQQESPRRERAEGSCPLAAICLDRMCAAGARAA